MQRLSNSFLIPKNCNLTYGLAPQIAIIIYQTPFTVRTPTREAGLYDYAHIVVTVDCCDSVHTEIDNNLTVNDNESIVLSCGKPPIITLASNVIWIRNGIEMDENVRAIL